MDHKSNHQSISDYFVCKDKENIVEFPCKQVLAFTVMLYKLQMLCWKVGINTYICIYSWQVHPIKWRLLPVYLHDGTEPFTKSFILHIPFWFHNNRNKQYMEIYSCILSLFIAHCVAHRMINQAAWRIQCCQQDPSCTAGFLWQFCNVPMTQHACWCQDSEYGPAHCFHSQTWKAEKMMLEGAPIYDAQKLMCVREGPATSWVFSRIITNFLYWIFESS